MLETLFLPLSSDASTKEVIAWWESRRIPYNLLVGSTGLLAFVVYCIAITTSGHLQPGEDLIEPFAVLLLPFFFVLMNLCYTAGWIVQWLVRRVSPSKGIGLEITLFRLGHGFSLAVVVLPAAIWTVIWFLTVLGLVRVETAGS